MELLIEDNGVGIPADYREKVFAIFERLDGFNTSQGTGVGLAMCRKITQDVGGSIDIIDSENGACFRVMLPEWDPGQSDGSTSGMMAQHA